MSDQAKHTPGPWTAERVPGGTRVTAEDSLSVAWCGNHYSTATGYIPFEANARLIAAAPELLAAVQALRNVKYDTFEQLGQVLTLADNAIAKATGAAP